MLAPYVPEDFDQFWAEAVAEATHSPLDFHRDRAHVYDFDGFAVETFEFRSTSGMKLHGWIALPESAPKKAPCFLWIPPYGRESTLPNEYSTREGMVSMSFNFHGNPAFHQEDYQPMSGYFAEGVEDPKTWIFRRMLMDCLLAVRALRSQLDVDEDRCAVAGLSQGGGMAIWTGAHAIGVRAVVADLPFLSCMPYVFGRNVYRYPLKEITDFANTIPLGMERVNYTMSYFDTINQATRLRVPSLISYGVKDPSCRPDTVTAVYNAIPGPKRLIEYPGGHDWDPSMIHTNRSFLLEQMQ